MKADPIISKEHSEAVFNRSLRKMRQGDDAVDALLDAFAEEFGTVYFLLAGPFIKIGFTRWPVQRRIAQLSTGCPYEICLAAKLCGSPETEREIHKAFANHHVRGEWFHASSEILSFIDSLSQADSKVAA